jgi:nucleolar protein 56
MKVYIVKCLFGVFAIDNKGKILAKNLFGTAPKLAANYYAATERNELSIHEKEVKSQLPSSTKIIFTYPKNNEVVEKRATIIKKFNDQLVKLGKLCGLKEEEIPGFQREFFVELAKIKIQSRVYKDQIIVQAILSLIEIEKVLNILSEKLRDWYELNFPEISFDIQDHEKFAKFIAKHGIKENLIAPPTEIKKKIESSIGIAMDGPANKILQTFAAQIVEFYKFRQYLTEYLEDLVGEVAPNLKIVCGAILAAKLIARAGSLETLAKYPSSTIQVIGAEKALFKHLSKGTPCPKHGLIYTHPKLQGVEKRKRGKLARKLASEISIAAKIDFFKKQPELEFFKKFEAKLVV